MDFPDELTGQVSSIKILDFYGKMNQGEGYLSTEKRGSKYRQARIWAIIAIVLFVIWLLTK
ncbi:hypothetical protein ASG65_27095 [Bacillus sp. Leaf13]|nr:hypothetical protein ASG65_27095 [Bacillus sp. Leaf13]